MRLSISAFGLGAALWLCIPAAAQTIDQQRGVDQQVDYSALSYIGPWDDRNYQLTQTDLSVLSDSEDTQSEAIPAFYRVQLRKQNPMLRRSGPAQYPRSALPRFLIEHNGYLVDGKYYRGVQREGKRWHVLPDAPLTDADIAATRMLNGEVRISSPTGAAESSIEANHVNPNIVIAGSNGPGSGQVMHYSTDGGASWTQSAPLPLGGTCCDPTIAWSADGTLAYAATLSFGPNYFYRSADNGQTWTDLANEPGNDPRREIGNSTDKEFLHVDISPTSPFKDSIYLTWHEANVMKFARSTNFGHTWTTSSFSTASSLRGIGSDITTDAAGNVYYFWPAFNSRTIKMAKSTNGGASFATPQTIASTQASFIFPVPSIETREVFVYVSADSDRSNGPFAGSIYAAWTDSTAATGGNPAGNHARIRVAYSRNGGSTWTVVTPHPTADALSVDRWHQWLAVDPNGVVHIIFYDTQRDPTRSSVDLYYTFSVNGAQSFAPLERLTSQQSPNINDSFEFGDYNGLAATLNHVIASFTDNRNESGGGGNSVDIYAAGKSTGSGNEIICDVETSKTAYVNGEQIVLSTLRYANLSASNQEVRLRLQLAFDPFFSATLIDAGGGGGLILPPGADLSFGPLPLFTVSAGFPRGAWNFRCAIEDPFSTTVLAEDTAAFQIN